MTPHQPHHEPGDIDVAELARAVAVLRDEVEALRAALPAAARADAARLPPGDGCAHDVQMLMRRACGGGGTQVRWYCRACGAAGIAVGHRAVPSVDALPLADPDEVEALRAAWSASRRAARA